MFSDAQFCIMNCDILDEKSWNYHTYQDISQILLHMNKRCIFLFLNDAIVD